MNSKNHYFNFAVAHFVAMLLFIVVFYVGIIMRHWLTFDVGMFGALIACISSIYNVTQYERAKQIDEQVRKAMELWELQYGSSYEEDDDDSADDDVEKAEKVM